MILQLSGNTQTPLPGVTASYRIESRLVLVPVTVVDRRGAFINGLTPSAFTVTEDGVRQTIRSFTEDDAPVSMGFVLDLSGSMDGMVAAAREGLRALLDEAGRGDEAFLNAVSTRPLQYSAFTEDLGRLLSLVQFQRAAGSTALIDTISLSLKQAHSGRHARKALIVISDGMDNHSQTTRDELLRQALESDAQIYTLALTSGLRPAKGVEMLEASRGRMFLDELAAKTGGISYLARDRAELIRSAAAIRRVLRNEYVIGYIPESDPADGRWRRIRVQVGDRALRVYARYGYRRD